MCVGGGQRGSRYRCVCGGGVKGAAGIGVCVGGVKGAAGIGVCVGGGVERDSRYRWVGGSKGQQV